jgi:branched-chain amino acid transport system ATP-binding protein
MLELKGVGVHYEKLEALSGVSISVQPASITSLIGANGAGKTTCLRAISGLVPTSSGEIWFDGTRIDGWAPDRIAKLGIAHVPEGKRLFLQMTVYQNLMAGAYLRRDRSATARELEKVYQQFPVLHRYRGRAAKTLSGGEQQMLALARGMMSDPRLYMFDEPSLGLAPLIVAQVAAHIEQLAEDGAAIILVEQNARLALRLAKRAYVLETGKIVLEGDAKVLKDNRHVKDAYLGVA